MKKIFRNHSKDDESIKTMDLTWSSRTRYCNDPRAMGKKPCLKVKTNEESLKSIGLCTGVEAGNNLSVRFGDVEVRSHEIILGDNPAVSKGPPLTIEWAHYSSTICTVERFEEVRVPTIRNYHELKMPAPVRFDLLSRTHPTKDIVKRTKQVTEVKKQRLETTSTLYKANSQEKIERLSRGFRNLVTNRKKKEKEFLEKGLIPLQV